MTTPAQHPDVVPYAQSDPLSKEQRVEIERHLADCGECRDLVLFIRKTNATLRYEGRVSRVAWAMRMSQDALEREIESGTSVAELLKRPPESPVSAHPAPTHPLTPIKK